MALRRLFGRNARPAIEVPTGPIVGNCAHGCPACPHPATFFESHDDADGASTLLPTSGTALDGEPLEFSFLGSVGAQPQSDLDLEVDGLDGGFEAD